MSFATDPTVGEPEEVVNANLDLAAAESGYIPPDVEADQDAIAQQVFTDLATRAPGWQAHDGNLDTWLIEAFSEVGAEIRSLAADVPASIFQTYGGEVLGILPKLALAATSSAMFTAVDDAGYTLDVGATFALSRSGNDLVAFSTTAEATIPPGSTTVDNVPFAALETGADGNNLAGAGIMQDAIRWVAGIDVVTPTGGGADAETPQDYLDRLANLMRVVALRPILPQDFAILALQIDGVGRAIALNLYDPSSGTWTNARTVTLIIAQADGTPCTAETKQAVIDQLDALREVNWVIHVVDPSYSAIAVDFAAVAYAGQDASTVHDTVVANLTRFLQPGNFRLGTTSPAIAGGEVVYPPQAGQPARRQVVRVNDLVSLVDQSLGVDYVTLGGLKINGAAADFQLPSVTTLPTPGAITGTVSGATP